VSVSFSPDGTRIVTGSLDKTVRLWDAATGEPVGEPLQGHTAWVSSVSFSPDGTRIVSGSYDSTVRLWNCEPRAMETTTTMPLNTCNNHLIRFSPHSVHALRNISELMDGVSHDYHSTTLFFLDSDSGWVIGPKHRLLFWVPPASRHLLYSPATALVIPSGGPELDLSRMAHGERWQQCRKR
ncbi:WD40-repeat-containing domain protein, partial [Suillus spraguei]